MLIVFLFEDHHSLNRAIRIGDSRSLGVVFNREMRERNVSRSAKGLVSSFRG